MDIDSTCAHIAIHVDIYVLKPAKRMLLRKINIEITYIYKYIYFFILSLACFAA